jgi:hypothetical protein
MHKYMKEEDPVQVRAAAAAAAAAQDRALRRQNLERDVKKYYKQATKDR